MCCVLGCRLLRLRSFGAGGAACGKCSFREDFPRGLSPWGPCVAFLVVVFSVFCLCCFQLLFPWLSSSPSSAFAVFSCVVFLVAVFSVFGLCVFQLCRFRGCCLLCLRPLWFSVASVPWLLSSLSPAFAVFSCVAFLVVVFSVFGLCGVQLCCVLGCCLLCLRPLWFSFAAFPWLLASLSSPFVVPRCGVAVASG